MLLLGTGLLLEMSEIVFMDCFTQASAYLNSQLSTLNSSHQVLASGSAAHHDLMTRVPSSVKTNATAVA